MASAAREVYNCIELRQLILSQLDLPDLATCMRLEKGCTEDAARFLYHTVFYGDVSCPLPALSPRQQSYLPFVKEITAETPWPRYGPTWLGTNRYPHMLDVYSVDTFNLYISTIRASSNIRKISSGDGEFEEWVTRDVDQVTVYFDPSTADDGPADSRPACRDSGHLIVDRFIEVCIAESPPSTLENALPPSDRYTVHTRFSLYFHADYAFTLIDEWLAAFRRKFYAAWSLRRIDFDDLPITLPDLTAVYRHQIESGSPDRLKHIDAGEIGPWDVEEFEEFAVAASAALRVFLVLPFSDDNALVSSVDLPAFIPLVRTHLTGLERLALEITSDEEAESACGAMLGADTLGAEGTVRDLRIDLVYDSHPPPLFNVLRLLSQLCAADADMEILVYRRKAIHRSTQPEKRVQFKTNFLHYLRSQSAEQRIHLCTVDFSTLGVTTIDDVEKLQYDDDGRPLPLRTGEGDMGTGVSVGEGVSGGDVQED